jgi:hypothetical protein
MVKVVNIARVDLDTGEIIGKEPPFVKAYVEHVAKVSGLTKMQNDVLWFLLSRMRFDNTVSVTKKLKDRFAERKGVSKSSFSNCISALAKSGLIEIEERSQYLVNPEYFTKSDWSTTRGFIAEWSFTDSGTEFKRKIIDENGDVIIDEDE